MQSVLKKMSIILEQRISSRILERAVESVREITDKEFIKNFMVESDEGSLNILYKYIVESVVELSVDSIKVLDVGCGPATLLGKIARELPRTEFTGVDMSSVMLDVAKENMRKKGITNIEFVNKSWFDLDDFGENSFDLITWNLAMHHCHNMEEVVRVIDSFLRILKPSGKFFIFDVLRPCSEKNINHFIQLFIANQNSTYLNNVFESFRAAYSFSEVEEILFRSAVNNYRHFEPFLLNYWQVIIGVSKEAELKVKKTFSSELEYKLFKLFMKCPIRKKVLKN